MFLHRKAVAERVWIIQNIFCFAVNNRWGKERKERINNSSYSYILYSVEKSGEVKRNALFGWLFQIWLVYGVVTVYGMDIQMCNVAIRFFIHLYQSCHEQRNNIKYYSSFTVILTFYCVYNHSQWFLSISIKMRSKTPSQLCIATKATKKDLWIDQIRICSNLNFHV